MKVLVTGSSSEIGTSLLEALSSGGHGTVAFDLEPPRRPVAGGMSVQRDIRDIDAVDQAAEDCDAGIHLAVRANDYRDAEIMSVNLVGAFAFFRAAHKHAFRMSVLASSAPVHLPAASISNDLLLNTAPDDAYDLSKKLQEVIARDFHAHGLPTLCLRFGHVVHGAAKTTLGGEPLDTLEYCRGGWVAIEDVVAGCLAALKDAGDQSFGIYNLVGSRSGRNRFDVAQTEDRLGIALAYDFSEYE